MIAFPNAKINLGLDITDRRPDGYHNLVTVFYPVAWRDILEIVPSASGADTLNVSGRGCDCPPEKNLVMKAVRTLRSICDIPPVDIYLRKVIPDGAGLGGGSSDAAFTLRMLRDMYNSGLSDDTLAEVASGIGADCPFFIYNRPMGATGIGNRLEPIEIPALRDKWIAVVKPPVSVSTKEAYAAVRPAAPTIDLREIVSREPLSRWQGVVKNDFEPSVFPAFPIIAEVKQRLYDLGAVYASMSGSGASVFAIFDNDSLSDTLRSEFSGCETFMTKSV